MKTRLISQSDWPTFFDRFSQRYDGCLATLEILSTEIGAQVEEQNLAFAGITDEWDETKGNTITIMLGAQIGNHVTHNINRPREVSLEQTDEGVDVALAIKSDDDSTALLRFRSAMLPEPVDAELTDSIPVSPM
jgi:hypothetical protein